MEERQCCKEVRPAGSHWAWGLSQCTRKGTVEVDGKWYCWQHDPARVERLRKEEEEKFDHKWDAQRKAAQRQRLEAKVCAGVTDENLAWIVSQGGLVWLLEAYEEAIFEVQSIT